MALLRGRVLRYAGHSPLGTPKSPIASVVLLNLIVPPA